MGKSVQPEVDKQQPRRWLSRSSNAQAVHEPLREGQPYFCSYRPFVFLLVMALIGLFATGFLTYRHVALASNVSSVGDSALCRADGKVNCDAVLLTEYSEILGYVSSAVLGLMGFVFVAWCALNGLVNERMRKLAWVCLVVYFFAAIGFSWYYMYLMIFEVDFLCTWCIVVHCVNVASLVFVVIVSVTKRREFLLREVATLGERVYFILGGVLLGLLVFFSCATVEKYLSFQDAKMKFEDIANDPVVIMATLRGSESYDIPVTRSDPIYGSPSAPYAVIFFSDFQCPICGKVETFLRGLVDSNPEILKLVFKNYPLSTECNHAVVGNLHPMACKAARAAYAAFLMGGSRAFWMYADLLFEHQKQLKDDSWNDFARKIGLDATRFQALLKPGSPVDQKIKDDLALGHAMRLSATPQIVFQGKRIPENLKGAFFIDTIEQLIRDANPDKELKLRKPWLPEPVAVPRSR